MTLADVDISGFRTVLLDRDGTINRQRVGDYVKCWDEFEFLPGALEALARFSKTARHIIVVTNQRGIGRGLMSESDLADIHSRMVSAIEAAGGRIDAIYHSSAIDDADLSRKPNTGMWQQIKHDFPDIDPLTTIMIGDSKGDKEFAENCNIDFVNVISITY